MSCPSRTNSSSRWTQLSPSFKTESPSQNETPPAGTSSQNEAQSALQKSVMDNQTMRQAITKAKQELKNIRQQIADEKSSAQPCNCDYDQLLNNIVHEQVDVNRRVLLSTAKTMSHATATSTHRHTTTEPQTGRDSGPASPCLNTKPTTTPSQPAATESQPISAPETVDEFVQTPTETRIETTTTTATSNPNVGTRD